MVQTLTAGDDSPRPQPDSRFPWQLRSPDRSPDCSPDCSLDSAPAPEPAPEPAQVRVRPGSPAELLAIVPHLLGFAPQASLVVMGTAPPRGRVKVTLRYDLPDPPGAGVAADIAAHAVGVVGSQQLKAMMAVAYGTETLVDPVAYALRDAARQAGIKLRDVLRVEGGRYWSYACGDEACCPAAGTPFDPAASPAAAAMAAAGMNAVGELIATYRGGGRYATDYQLAWITVALRDLRVRDDAWARMEPAHLDAHRRLWID